jgi:hypothetical protein
LLQRKSSFPLIWQRLMRAKRPPQPLEISELSFEVRQRP